MFQAQSYMYIFKVTLTEEFLSSKEIACWKENKEKEFLRTSEISAKEGKELTILLVYGATIDNWHSRNIKCTHMKAQN